MPTLSDVAKKAGVSTATVSKVLSNTPYFTDATRDKVMHAVKELNYQPNLAARALSKGKTSIIAVVFPYVYENIFEDPLVMSILQGIEGECTQQGYNLLLSTPQLSEDGADSHYLQLLQSGYIAGLIAIDNVTIASAAKPAIERNIPSIVIGYHPADYTVRADDEQGARELTEHVLSLGQMNIGIISVPENQQLAVNTRIQGIQQACNAHQLIFKDLPIAYGDYSIESGYLACRDLLEQNEQVNAIISINDRMALGAIQYLREIGRDVPNDCVVVGFDNIPTSAVFSPSLTTVDQQAPEQGSVAAQMLIDVLNGEQPDSVVLPTQLIIRESSQSG